MNWKEAKSIITSDRQVVAELTNLESQYQAERSKLMKLRPINGRAARIRVMAVSPVKLGRAPGHATRRQFLVRKGQIGTHD